MTTAVILLAVALVVTISLYVLTTVQFRQVLHATLLTLDSVHLRDGLLLNKTLDRLMARDFPEFKGYESAETADEGSVESPFVPPPEWRAAAAMQRETLQHESENPTVMFESDELPPRGEPLVRGERWVPPEARGIDPTDEEVPIEDR
jgi:hypothetical protein